MQQPPASMNVAALDICTVMAGPHESKHCVHPVQIQRQATRTWTTWWPS